MKSSIWLWCYVAAGALGLGYSCMQLLSIFKDPVTIASMMTMSAMAWQLPLYFMYGRNR